MKKKKEREKKEKGDQRTRGEENPKLKNSHRIKNKTRQYLDRQEKNSQSEKQGRIKVLKYLWCLQFCDGDHVGSQKCAGYGADLSLWM